MAALTDDRNTKREAGILREFPVAASTTIYAGSMVCLNTSGYAVPGADTASFIYVGVAQEKADNSSGSNGDLNVETRIDDSVHEFAGSGLAVTDVGATAYVSDDQTIATSTTNSIAAGKIIGIESATSALVKQNI